MKYIQYPARSTTLKGKCLMISFPYHELNLIEALDELTRADFALSRSHYIRDIIKKNFSQLREQQKELAAA